MHEDTKKEPAQREMPPETGVGLSSHASVRVLIVRMWAVLSNPWWDVAAILILFVFGVYISLGYLNAIDYAHKSRTDWCGPAVMVAEGRGMGEPNLRVMKNLSAFINGEASSWDPTTDPGDAPLLELGFFQRDHKNLIYSAALFWKLFGYNWAAIMRLHALFAAVSVVLAYGIARLVMPKPLALCVALLFLFSPVHIQQLPEIRDYSKAPFIFFAIFCCGYLARRPRRVWTALGLAAVLGASVGLGLGFRLDMTICIAPAVATLLFFAPGPWKRRLWLGPVCVLLFLVSLYGAGKPSIDIIRQHGSTGSHNIHGGLYWQFDMLAGCRPSYYRHLFLFLDGYIYETTASYYRRMHDPTALLRYRYPEYFEAGRRYLLEYAQRFPADILLRAIGCSLRMTESVPVDLQREYGTTPFIERCAYSLAPLLVFLCHAGRYLALAAVLIAAVHQFRWGLFLLAMLLYFCGYPSLQYMPRHCFHLSLVPWWNLGFCITAIVAGSAAAFRAVRGNALRAAFPHPGRLSRPAVRVAGVLLLAVIGVGVPTYCACVYQEAWVKKYVSNIAEAPRDALAITPVQDKANVLLGCGDLFAHPTPEQKAVSTASAYLAVELAGPPQRVPLGVCFKSKGFRDSSYVMPIDIRAGAETQSTWVYFPVYSHFDKKFENSFAGISVPEGQKNLVRGIYTVRTAREFALWPTLFLWPGWESIPARLWLEAGHSPYPVLLEKVLQLRTQLRQPVPSGLGH